VPSLRWLHASVRAPEGGSMIDWRIYERDVDVILAEEFYANSAFAHWIKSRSKSFRDVTAEVIAVQISRADEKASPT
jgi:hypothetical protein